MTLTETCRLAASTSLTEMALPSPTEKARATSSLVLCAPGTVLTGASFTPATFTVTVSVSCRAVPPLLPWSLVESVMEAVPAKLADGANTVPLSAVLMAASVPVNTIEASPAPSPVEKVRPATPPRAQRALGGVEGNSQRGRRGVRVRH